MSTSDTFKFLQKDTADILTLLSADVLEELGLFSMKNTRKVLEQLKCHSADYLKPFSSLYLKVLWGSNSVMVRLNGG